MLSTTVLTRPAADLLDTGPGMKSAARAAAALTVGSIATLGAFYSVGEPWGTINDGLTIALAAATVPIAVGLARRNGRSLLVTCGAAVDVVGVLLTVGFTTLLIARVMTFEASLPYVLVGQALIGCWLVAVGLAAWGGPGQRRLAGLAIAGGLGLATTVGGYWLGEFTHPLTMIAGAVGVLGTAGFYALLSVASNRAD